MINASEAQQKTNDRRKELSNYDHYMRIVEQDINSAIKTGQMCITINAIGWNEWDCHAILNVLNAAGYHTTVLYNEITINWEL